MAKKGSAQATIGLDYSAFEAGARAVLRIQKQIGGAMKQIGITAAGVGVARGVSAFAVRLYSVVPAVSKMAVEFDNIRSATGVIASDLQAMRFSSQMKLGFADSKTLLGGVGKVWEKYSGAIRDAAVRYEAASERAKAAWAAIIGQLAPVFSKVLDGFARADFVSKAEAFGKVLSDAVKTAYNLLTSGDIFKVLSLSAEYFKEQMISTGEWLLDAFGTAIPAVFSLAVMAFSTQLENVFVNGPKILLGGLLMAFGAAHELMIATIQNWAAPFADLVSGFFEKLVSAMGAVNEFFSKSFTEVINNLASMIYDAFTTALVGAAKGFQDAILGTLGLVKKTVVAVYADPKVIGETGKGLIKSGAGGIADNAKTQADSIAAAIRKILDTPRKDSAATAGITAAIAALLKKNAPGNFTQPTDLKNATVGQKFAASSLAAIGGGGGVGPTSQQTMTDLARQQVNLQKEMATSLRLLTQGGSPATATQARMDGAGVGISNFRL